MADLLIVEHGDGHKSVGFEDEGVFIPIATVTAARLAQLKQRAADLDQREAEGDDEEGKRVAEARASLPTSGKSKSKPSKSNKSEEGVS